MTSIQIPNLGAATALSGTEQLEIVQAGVSVRTTTQDVANLAAGAAPSLVSQLPSATGRAGQRRFVSNANATTFNSIVAGGGANFVPVFCDGTNWRIG